MGTPAADNVLSDNQFLAGDDVTTAFTLNRPVNSASAIQVTVCGVVQRANSYSVAGTQLVFSEAPPKPIVAKEGAYNIEVAFKASVQQATVNYTNPPAASNTNTGDVIQAAYNPVIGSLTNNLLLYVVMGSANLTTTPTFSPNGQPAKAVVDGDGSAVPIGKLKGTVLLRYNSSDQKWYLAGTAGSGQSVARGTLSGTNIAAGAVDLLSYGAFDWSLTGNSVVAFPSTVPAAGTWYIDVQMDSTGGYSLTWNAGYNLSYSYYFDAIPNARYRFWLVARSSAVIDVSVERVA